MANALRRRAMFTYRVRRRLVDLAISSQDRHPRLRAMIPAEVGRLAEARADREIARHRTQFVVARRQPVVNMWDLAAHTADQVSAALDAVGVPFFAMHRPFTRTSRWAVCRDQLPELVLALASTLGPEAFYYQFSRTSPTRPVSHGLTQEVLASLQHLRICQFVRCQTTRTLHASSIRIDIAI